MHIYYKYEQHIYNSHIILLIKCTFSRSSPQLLPSKDEYTFHLSNFLIIVFSKSFANRWLDIISYLIPLPIADLSTSEAVFLSKNLSTVEARPL